MNKLVQERMDEIDQELKALGTYMDTNELYELAVLELKKEGKRVDYVIIYAEIKANDVFNTEEQREIHYLIIWLLHNLPITTEIEICIQPRQGSIKEHTDDRADITYGIKKGIPHLISIYLDNNTTFGDILNPIIHEFIHAWQYDRGDYNPVNKIWKGIDYSDYDYLDTPWEIEAWEFSKDLLLYYSTVMRDIDHVLQLEAMNERVESILKERNI